MVKSTVLFSSRPPLTADPFRAGVPLMAIAVAVLVLLGGYFSDRHGGVDEIGLYNPTYMDVNYGRMTYPVHGYYDVMAVHPPVHYKAIAALMRFGFTLYYAQATPTVLMLMLVIWLTVTGPFTSPVKMGLLFGTWTSIAAFSKFGIEYFGMRPEGDLNSAWLAGLIALESARLERWNPKKLFVGAVLLTYAATMHYYAVPAVLGVLVYAAWALHDLGWKSSRRLTLTIVAGTLVTGIPVLALWALPNIKAVLLMILATHQGGGVPVAVREHQQLYHWWAGFRVEPPWLQALFASGVPAVLISTPILLAIRCTRALGLAALPLQVVLLLFAWHKHAYYFFHEVALYNVAIVAGILTILELAVARLPGRILKQASGALAAMVLIASLWHQTYWNGGLKISLEPRVHESEIARAAGREMLGSRAKVASRLAPWYAAGAADWYNPEQDLLWTANTLSNENVADYLSRFDAVAETGHMSNDTHNQQHKVLLSWYLDGILHLRGFFFAEANTDLTYLLLQTPAVSAVTGFGLKHNQLYRFTQDSRGNYGLIAVYGPQTSVFGAICNHAMFCNVMTLPPPGSTGSTYGLLTAITSIEALHDLDTLAPEFSVAEKRYGTLTPVDKSAFLARLRSDDRPIRFHPRINPGYSPPGVDPDIELRGFTPPPPPGAIPLTKLIDVTRISQGGPDASVARGTTYTVTTAASMGAYAAAIPLDARSTIKTPCWVEIRANVRRGRVGIGIFNRTARNFLQEPSLLGDTGTAMLDLYMRLTSLENGDDLIIRSARSDLRSEITVAQVVVWIPKEDWPRYTRQLESFR